MLVFRSTGLLASMVQQSPPPHHESPTQPQGVSLAPATAGATTGDGAVNAATADVSTSSSGNTRGEAAERNVVDIWTLAIAFAVVVLLSVWLLPGRLAAWSIVLGAAMLAIAASDAARFIVPDWLSLPSVLLGLLASGYLAHPGSAEVVTLDSLAGMALGGLGLWAIGEGYARLRGRQGLGFGDVKLAAAGGAWVGATLMPQVLLLASGSALALVLASAARRGTGVHRHERIPFGAFLAPAIWVVWLLDTSGLVG